MRIQYPKLRNMAHTTSLNVFTALKDQFFSILFLHSIFLYFIIVFLNMIKSDASVYLNKTCIINSKHTCGTAV